MRSSSQWQGHTFNSKQTHGPDVAVDVLLKVNTVAADSRESDDKCQPAEWLGYCNDLYILLKVNCYCHKPSCGHAFGSRYQVLLRGVGAHNCLMHFQTHLLQTA